MSGRLVYAEAYERAYCPLWLALLEAVWSLLFHQGRAEARRKESLG